MLLPLLLMGVGLGGWRWLERSAAVTPGTPRVTATVISSTVAAATLAPTGDAEPADPVGDGIGRIVGPATPWAVAGLGEAEPGGEAATTPVATAAAIALLGPPSGSAFGREDIVSFYWIWPGQVSQGQQFVVYLAAGDARSPLGAVVGANLGSGYQLQAAVGQVAGDAGNHVWQVFLEDEATGAVLGQSAARTITIIGE